jgi:hypothetical protein
MSRSLPDSKNFFPPYHYVRNGQSRHSGAAAASPAWPAMPLGGTALYTVRYTVTPAPTCPNSGLPDTPVAVAWARVTDS